MASYTIWTRLEGRPREASMERSLRAEVRDPAWLLARQWQIGEFLGDDAGSPISATVRYATRTITSFRPGLAGTPQALDPALPLEAHVEREPAPRNLHLALQLGRSAETFALEEGDDAGVDVGDGIAALREQFRIAATPSADAPDAEATAALRALASGRIVDGVQLVDAIAAHVGSLDTMAPLPAVAASQRAPLARALERVRDLAAGLLSEPAGAGDSSWMALALEHAFAVGVDDPDDPVTLDAPRFGGGHLDWYAFDVKDGALAPEHGVAGTVEQHAFIPNGVRFRGMPHGRWWQLEDGMTDFGALDAKHVDLAKLLVMEFALVYADDWFQLPLRLPVGTLAHVETLVLTDTFGERTIVRPTGVQVPPGGEAAWRMFTLSGAVPEQDLTLLAPTVGVVDEGRDLEDVLFLRDEMAAMGWAVERTLAGELDTPVQGDRRYLERREASPPVKPTRAPGGPDVRWIAGTEVPDDWIPLVPVQNGPRSFVFRRGIMGTPGARPARAVVLEPGHPLYIADEAILRAGTRVTRRYRRTRWSDGSTVVWLGRRSRTGRGSGASGLMFDVLDPLEEP